RKRKTLGKTLVREILPEQVDEAAYVLAEAMKNNPLWFWVVSGNVVHQVQPEIVGDSQMLLDEQYFAENSLKRVQYMGMLQETLSNNDLEQTDNVTWTNPKEAVVSQRTRRGRSTVVIVPQKSVPFMDMKQFEKLKL